MLQTMKNSWRKRSGGQGMGKIGEFRRGTWRKSEVRKRWSMKQGRRAKSSFCLTDGHTTFEKCWIGIKNTNTGRWYCKRWFCVLRSFHWTRIISISNDSRQNHGYQLQITRLLRTSSRRSISLYPRSGRWSQIVETSQIALSRHLDSSTTTNGLHHGPVSKTQSLLLSEICTVILRQALWERQVVKTLSKHGWEKIPDWEGVSLCNREKGLS